MSKQSVVPVASVAQSHTPKNLRKLPGTKISKLSKEAFSLSEEYLGTLSRNKVQPQFVGVICRAGEELMRIFLPVEIGDTFYWADAVTGSLYNLAGQCKTSNVLHLREEPWPVTNTKTLADSLRRAA